MLRLSSEEIASIGVVLAALKLEAAKLDPTSKVAGLWRDGIDLLKPTHAGVEDRALTLRLSQVNPPDPAS